MQLHVKTIDEVRTSRVTLQLEGDPDEVAKAISMLSDEGNQLLSDTLAVELDKAKADVRKQAEMIAAIQRSVMAGSVAEAMEQTRGRESGLGAAGWLLRGTVAEVHRIVTGQMSMPRGLNTRLYTAEEVGDAQASEAELVSAPLRAELDTMTRLYQEVKEQADQNRGWAERTEDHLADKAAKLDQARLTVQALSSKIDRIQREVSGSGIPEALASNYVNGLSCLMQDRIRKIREILDIPTHEEHLKTSQS